MKKRQSVADQIIAAIPEGRAGLSLEDAAGFVGGPLTDSRKAFEKVAADGHAMLVRRGHGGRLFLVRLDAGVLSCVMCQREYQRGKKSKRVTCSTPCAMSYGWAKAGPEAAKKRGEAIAASHDTPEQRARLAAHNKRRWAKPSEKEKLAAQNRREWKDPEKAAIRAAKIRINHQKPEMREFYSKLRKSDWQRPEYAEMVKAKAHASQKVAAYRARFSTLMKQRWADGDLRKKYTAANIARNKIKSAKAKAAREVRT